MELTADPWDSGISRAYSCRKRGTSSRPDATGAPCQLNKPDRESPGRPNPGTPSTTRWVQLNRPSGGSMIGEGRCRLQARVLCHASHVTRTVGLDPSPHHDQFPHLSRESPATGIIRVDLPRTTRASSGPFCDALRMTNPSRWPSALWLWKRTPYLTPNDDGKRRRRIRKCSRMRSYVGTAIRGKHSQYKTCCVRTINLHLTRWAGVVCALRVR
jgi:hypothetical protein